MPQPFIDFAHVKEHASFERILVAYNLQATGSGQERAVLCPFHQERRPSCKVSLDKRVFQCFACGAKGNVLEFVAKLEKSDLRTAAQKIATICQISVAPPRAGAHRPVTGQRDEPTRPAARLSPPPCEAPTEPAETAGDERINPPLTFTLKLQNDHPYLTGRGLSEETIAAFGLGFCNRGMMKGRVCIPIHDADGNLVAYAGRWAEDGDLPEGEDRYRLPPKFAKARVLFNFNRLPPDVPHIVLVEGFWSTIRLHLLGVPVAALMGWSISQEQIALLQARGTTHVTLLLDGDKTGSVGRERVLPFLAEQFYVRSPSLPDGEKPDTMDADALLRACLPPNHFS